jgi:hypothetical protein
MNNNKELPEKDHPNQTSLPRKNYEKPAILEEEPFTTLAFACSSPKYGGTGCGTRVPPS